MACIWYQQESNLDCGIAAFITCIRILGYYKLKVADIYAKFLAQIDVCVVDLAAALLNLGTTRFKLRSTTFEIDSTINEHTTITVKYISDMRANVEALKHSFNLV
jgi:hypothetical protein